MNTQNVIAEMEAHMQKALEHTLHEFNTLHTGKASPAMVEGLLVEAYGSSMRLREVAAIMTPDARTIQIEPWDKGLIRAVEKAIQIANVGLNPVVTGGMIRCPIPELSGDRRRELVKTAGVMTEEGRVRIRSIRRETLDIFKKAQKAGDLSEDDLQRQEKEVQKRTDHFTNLLEKALAQKEKELTTL